MACELQVADRLPLTPASPRQTASTVNMDYCVVSAYVRGIIQCDGPGAALARMTALSQLTGWQPKWKDVRIMLQAALTRADLDAALQVCSELVLRGNDDYSTAIQTLDDLHSVLLEACSQVARHVNRPVSKRAALWSGTLASAALDQAARAEVSSTLERMDLTQASTQPETESDSGAVDFLRKHASQFGSKYSVFTQQEVAATARGLMRHDVAAEIEAQVAAAKHDNDAPIMRPLTEYRLEAVKSEGFERTAQSKFLSMPLPAAQITARASVSLACRTLCDVALALLEDRPHAASTAADIEAFRDTVKSTFDFFAESLHVLIGEWPVSEARAIPSRPRRHTADSGMSPFCLNNERMTLTYCVC